MKPPPFQYQAPTTVDAVAALLATHTEDARVIAGGQSLIPLMNLRMVLPDVLIDLNRVSELTRITLKDGRVHYGAMVRQSAAQMSELTTTHCPLISKAIHRAGPVAVRNRGTVGGTLAHADRSAELPGVAVALDATFVITSARGQREVPAREFFEGDMETVIEADEFLTAVSFPAAPAGSWTAFDEVGVRREGVALVGLACQILPAADGTLSDIRLAVTGIDSVPVRLDGIEDALAGRPLNETLVEEAAALASSLVEPVDDIFTSAQYRRAVVGALVKRTLLSFLKDQN